MGRRVGGRWEGVEALVERIVEEEESALVNGARGEEKVGFSFSALAAFFWERSVSRHDLYVILSPSAYFESESQKRGVGEWQRHGFGQTCLYDILSMELAGLVITYE